MSHRNTNYFDEGMGMVKATYISFPQAVPLVATIDKDYCIDCKLCDQACGNLAIKHDQEPEEIELDIGTIIVATGYDPYNPTEKKEWSYESAENIITGLELERLINASGPTQGTRIKTIRWRNSQESGLHSVCRFKRRTDQQAILFQSMLHVCHEKRTVN